MFKKLATVFLMLLLALMSVQPAFAAKVDIEDLLVTILNEAIKESQKTKEEPEDEPAPAPEDEKNNYPKAALIYQKNAASLDHIKFYTEPNGKILKSGIYSDELYVDSTPVINRKDNSRWYKVIYCWPYADFTIREVQKWSTFGQNFAYVRAQDVNLEPISGHVADEINWLLAGRPPRYKVGDVFDAGGRNMIIDITAPAVLLEEPREGSKQIRIRKGLKCVGPAYGTEDSFPFCHSDMENENWAMLVDAKSHKVLGWTKGLGSAWEFTYQGKAVK